MIITKEVYYCICNKCSYEWFPKCFISKLKIKHQIKMCPKCKTTKWNNEDIIKKHSAQP